MALCGTRTTFVVDAIKLSLSRFAHSIPWSKQNSAQYIDWKTYKANGVNLGAWLEQEKDYDYAWWNKYSPTTFDEWNFCKELGSRCGPVLEARYAAFITNHCRHRQDGQTEHQHPPHSHYLCCLGQSSWFRALQWKPAELSPPSFSLRHQEVQYARHHRPALTPRRCQLPTH